MNKGNPAQSWHYMDHNVGESGQDSAWSCRFSNVEHKIF